MYEDINRKIQYIEFTDMALKNMVLQSVLSSYVENGGNEIAIIGVNFENQSIQFETEDGLAPLTKIITLVRSFRDAGVESAKVSTGNITAIFHSSDGGNEWVVGVGDNINFIECIIESVWYSLFEL